MLMAVPMAEDDKLRLDQALVSRGLVPTRARARDLILRGEVIVGGIVNPKPAHRVDGSVELKLLPGAGEYVSRGALKLQAALDAFDFVADGRCALDVGASTGGFTEVLLKRGAVTVFAVENGKDQLHPKLRTDPRVKSLEETDALSLTSAEVPVPISAIVADVSFTSLTRVLPVPIGFAKPGCWLVGLIKPQFEAGRVAVPKDGVIKDRAVQELAIARVQEWLSEQKNWRVAGVIESPIKGGSGNAEFLIGAVYAGD